jgi:hypothetical protein
MTVTIYKNEKQYSKMSFNVLSDAIDYFSKCETYLNNWVQMANETPRTGLVELESVRYGKQSSYFEF